MQYSNLKNEADQEEGRPKVARKFNINMSTEDLLKKKESYWFLALIITLIIIGSIIFYCAHTGVSLPNGGQRTSSRTTSTTTRRTTVSPTKILLYTGQGYKYYKVSVKNGTRLEEGRVSEACAEAGMEAVCSGPSSCKYTDINKCTITPLSINCNNPMYPLSKILCSGNKPKNCDYFEGVFSYMKHWYGGECGSVGSDWCANGDDFVSGTRESSPGRVQSSVETYYGYCAQLIP